MHETAQNEEKRIEESAQAAMSDNQREEPTDQKDEQIEENDEEGEEEDEEGELEHPIDSLVGVIEEIDNQLTRMVKRNRNPTNLKSELVNNVYPLLQQGFRAILDWMTAIEGSDDEDEQNDMEEVQNFQKEMYEQIKTNAQNCELLVSLEDTIRKTLLSAEREKFEEVISWAKSMIEKSKTLLEEKE